MRQFQEINDLYPDTLRSENYIIYKQILEESHLSLYTNNIGELYKDQLVVGREYVFLYSTVLEKAMMTNHESETITNQKFIDVAKGDVLIFGLGLGLIILPLLNDSNISKITVVEIDSGLVDIVYPILRTKDNFEKLEVINSDGFLWSTDKLYDTIYFDIWATIDKNSFSEMSILKKRYINNLKEDGWIDSWCSELENKKD
jgi:spermidine synthase